VLRLSASFDELGKAARDAAGWHSCLDLLPVTSAARLRPAARGPLAASAPGLRRAVRAAASAIGPRRSGWTPAARGRRPLARHPNYPANVREIEFRAAPSGSRVSSAPSAHGKGGSHGSVAEPDELTLTIARHLEVDWQYVRRIEAWDTEQIATSGRRAGGRALLGYKIATRQSEPNEEKPGGGHRGRA